MEWYDYCAIVFLILKIIQWVLTFAKYSTMSVIEKHITYFDLRYSDLALIFIPIYLLFK